jgi:hypothetical protein
MKATTTGVDLANNPFQVHGVDRHSKPNTTEDHVRKRHIEMGAFSVVAHLALSPRPSSVSPPYQA